MKEVLKREYNLLGKTRLSHIWHMTVEKDDKPLISTDGALNVLPNVKTKMHILKNVINFSNRIGISRPKVAVLSATEGSQWVWRKYRILENIHISNKGSLYLFGYFLHRYFYKLHFFNWFYT